MGAMLTRQPFTLSVHVHALDRRRERQRLKLGYRRLFAINRGAERAVACPTSTATRRSTSTSSCSPRWPATSAPSLFQVSIYQSLRARGPTPDLARAARGGRLLRRGDRVGRPTARSGAASSASASCGTSTLPLGRDVARRTRRYATRNAADTVPLVGTSCGSPTGIPFAFADPGRTLELLNPYDPEHANHTLLIAGRSARARR